MDAKQTIQPVPIVPIEAAEPAAPKPAEDDGDSTADGVEHHGFASGAADVSSTPGVPWERRPLSRRGILAWTIAAMSGFVALLTTMAVARSHPTSSAADRTSPTLHGAEANDATNAAGATLGAANAPVPVTETHSPPIIPLESLPLDDAPTPPRHMATASNRGHARAARSTPGSITVKKAAPSQKVLRQRTTGKQ